MHRRSFVLGLGALSFAPVSVSQDIKPAAKLIAAARKQIGVTRGYDGAYQSLAYPNGDIARTTGVCTDVIIRAYRDAFRFDLQSKVHEDMREAFSSYPRIWSLTQPDRNIDHRRVPNLEAYLQRQNAKRALPADIGKLTPGDLVTMRLPRNLPHIAIISDKSTRQGTPYIIHNIGAGTREEPLTSYQLDTMLHTRFWYLETLMV